MESVTPDQERAIRMLRAATVDRDVARSLRLLAVVVLFAVVGLCLDGNWPKVARVSASVLVYAMVLTQLSRRGTGALEWWWFACAGACAGVTSAVVRGSFDVRIVPAQVIGGALIGTVHWAALRYAPRLEREHAARS